MCQPWHKLSPVLKWRSGTGISREIINRLNTEIERVLFLPDVKKQMADIAVEVTKSTPNELAELTRADADKWGKIIRELNITPL